ncbi:hypothetical protein Ccel_0245 [Ruminiclostridium cellulolyticum H10]|uniref:Uncharacterized protein n=1 Tax=Ruminiclostridium cellulolyticum (strain ATCC 35319 / DSM 5812 / JCM 6584 / H10) TaxID=394503 RepID=B8I552_RUMCH|nr:hypothetical protein Ccel_0245 [Ruminiclostridium cellulolyticum H10]
MEVCIIKHGQRDKKFLLAIIFLENKNIRYHSKPLDIISLIE